MTCTHCSAEKESWCVSYKDSPQTRNVCRKLQCDSGRLLLLSTLSSFFYSLFHQPFTNRASLMRLNKSSAKATLRYNFLILYLIIPA